jgi:hypothetical protein
MMKWWAVCRKTEVTLTWWRLGLWADKWAEKFRVRKVQEIPRPRNCQVQRLWALGRNAEEVTGQGWRRRGLGGNPIGFNAVRLLSRKEPGPSWPAGPHVFLPLREAAWHLASRRGNRPGDFQGKVGWGV